MNTNDKKLRKWVSNTLRRIETGKVKNPKKETLNKLENAIALYSKIDESDTFVQRGEKIIGNSRRYEILQGGDLTIDEMYNLLTARDNEKDFSKKLNIDGLIEMLENGSDPKNSTAYAAIYDLIEKGSNKYDEIKTLKSVDFLNLKTRLFLIIS